MLRFSPAITATQAEHYYKHEFARGDYYTEGQTIIASAWRGAGAYALGLMGAVKPHDFAQLLAGRDPRGRVLVPARAGKTERRAAWDVTISPHKSVSLVALVGGDKRVIEAHERAVETALAELERHAQAWTKGGRETVTTGHAVIATFRHETSRALDPQLHTHSVVLNVTRRADGQWRALQEQGLFRAQKLAREIYEAELGENLASATTCSSTVMAGTGGINPSASPASPTSSSARSADVASRSRPSWPSVDSTAD